MYSGMIVGNKQVSSSLFSRSLSIQLTLFKIIPSYLDLNVLDVYFSHTVTTTLHIYRIQCYPKILLLFMVHETLLQSQGTLQLHGLEHIINIKVLFFFMFSWSKTQDWLLTWLFLMNIFSRKTLFQLRKKYSNCSKY